MKSKSVSFIAACFAMAQWATAANPPSWLTPGVGYGSGRIALDWPAVSGATGYRVKRADSPAGPYVLLGSTNSTTTAFSDATAVAGQKYHYAVTSIDASGESASFRSLAASPGIITDNSDSANVTITGSWPASALAGCYGTNSVFAATTSASSPTASFRFAPNLPFFGNYDVYLRCPATTNRATNTPVDIRHADGALTTVTINQTLNNNAWVLLGTFPCPSGTSSSVTIRNNTGASGAYVAADAVQFVPRLTPWAPRGIGMEDYSVPTFADECSGSALDPDVWSLALKRPNVSVGNGKISLDIDYIGPGTAATATLEELKNPFHWNKGAVMPVRDQKFGYYETRFRVVQQGGGVDCAFWMQSRGSLLPYENFEFDSPETFPDADLTETDLIYGMWDHRGGSPPWRMNKITYPRSWALNYHTYGMEWKTDNSIIHYLDGEEIGRTPGVASVNGIVCMAPIETYLSCYVGNYWQPAASIDGQSMKVDYLRCYQKPGWLGAAPTNTWGDARNWGPDGIPSSGEAAMFNLKVSQPFVNLLADKQVQSLCFDGPDVSPMVIGGSYQLELGVGPTSVEQGGISMGSAVRNDQTIQCGILGVTDLSFINNSHSGAALRLNGPIDGSGGTRKIHFAVNAPIVVAQPLGPSIGNVIKWGKANLDLPANSAYTGRTELAMGLLSFNHLANGGQNSGLGRSSSSASNVQFRPRSKYTDEEQRPRLRYTGPAASTNRGVTLGYFCDGILDASGTGPVTFTGALAWNEGNTSTAIFELSGSNPDENTYAGTISDANATNPSGADVHLKFRKTGAGKWVLGAANSWRGATEITDGTLVIGKSLVSGGGLICSGTSTLHNRGAITAASCDFSGSSYLVEVASAGAAVLNVSGGVTLGGTLELALTGDHAPGSTFTLINKSGAAPIGGTFAGLPDNTIFISGSRAWQINYQGGDGNDLVVTLLAHQLTWRHTYFKTTDNAGDAADMADPDSDGLNNLMEFATGSAPDSPNGSTTGFIRKDGTIEFTYCRSHAAVADGVDFVVEWSDTLRRDWSEEGVVQLSVPNTDNGSSTLWKATLPAGSGRRFVHLKTTSYRP
ncbi:MAG: hypothetical protein RLZZ505_667 [Verrucomicrobiota bacterium]|jgi:autotransporter-associated beta strand protein